MRRPNDRFSVSVFAEHRQVQCASLCRRESELLVRRLTRLRPRFASNFASTRPGDVRGVLRVAKSCARDTMLETGICLNAQRREHLARFQQHAESLGLVVWGASHGLALVSCVRCGASAGWWARRVTKTCVRHSVKRCSQSTTPRSQSQNGGAAAKNSVCRRVLQRKYRCSQSRQRGGDGACRRQLRNRRKAQKLY